MIAAPVRGAPRGVVVVSTAGPDDRDETRGDERYDQGWMDGWVRAIQQAQGGMSICAMMMLPLVISSH